MASSPRARHVALLVLALAALLALPNCGRASPATTQPAAATRPTTQSGPPAYRSPEFHPDGSVTFRIYAPKAASVSWNGEWGFGGKGAAMTRDARGLWSVTLEPTPANLYGYSLSLDGVRILDPRSNLTKPGGELTSVVETPGPAGGPRNPYAWRDVPHGTLHIEHYRSTALGKPSRLHIYTPPGYENQPQRRYPVLYLLHGSADDDSTWAFFGRAPYLLDNLLSEGKAQPMLMVFTENLGQAARPASAPGTATQPAPDKSRTRRANFSAQLLRDILPLVDAHYRTIPDGPHRAIVGLSLGGGEAVHVGLTYPDQFAWVASFSGGWFLTRPAKQWTLDLPQDPAALNARLRLLYLTCGKSDDLFAENQALAAELTKLGVQHEWRPGEGNHSWPLWRENLRAVLPRLFQ